MFESIIGIIRHQRARFNEENDGNEKAITYFLKKSKSINSLPHKMKPQYKVVLRIFTYVTKATKSYSFLYLQLSLKNKM